jgi:hypothetical protein
MESNFLIVIFKNKQQYKIMKKYQKFSNVEHKFNSLINESNNVFFDIKTENGRKVKYELAILEKRTPNSDSVYITDELGRNIKVDLDNSEYNILKIAPYNFAEKLTNIDTKERIDASVFVKKYFKGAELKLISKLNNKIIFQENENIFLFSLKSSEDAERFLISLTSYLQESSYKNCLMVKDTDVAQKKYLYDMLAEKGYNKKMLYRVSTTHLRDK